jgi:type VI protein secretion system component VasK
MRRIVTIIFALICSLVFLNSVLALSPAEMGAFMIVSFVGLLLFWFIMIVLVFGGIIFWLWMFVDCLVREDFRGQNDKIVWVLVLLFTSLLGAILYYFLVKARKKKAIKRKAAKPAARKTKPKKTAKKK